MTHELEVIERKRSLPAEHPPLLFVHGSAHGAWCWAEHFLDYFADQGFSAYALSLRGHGASGGRKRLRWASIADYVDDVARVAATLPSTPVVVGHSLGGMVVQQYLARHVAPAAVLLTPGPPGGNRDQAARMGLRHPWLAIESLLTLDPGRGFATPARARTATAYGAEMRILPDIAHDLMLDPGWRRAADAMLDWLTGTLASGRTDRVDRPAPAAPRRGPVDAGGAAMNSITRIVRTVIRSLLSST